MHTSGAYDYILLEDGTAHISGYRGYHSELILPDAIDGHTVTEIGDSAFLWQTGLTSVTIPETVTEIGDRAFGWCEGLTRIAIPDSVRTVRENPFIGCSRLAEIFVSDSHPALETIDGVLFDKTEKRLICYPCTLEAAVYDIPNGTLSVGSYAFFNCSNLKRVSIPGSVFSLGSNPFCGCVNLKAISVVPDHLLLRVINEALYEVSSRRLICYPCASDTASYQIPHFTLTIDQDAFYGCVNLTEITIPNTVTAIQDSAFFGCTGLTTLSIPDSVTSIGDSAFARCTGLTRVSLPSSIQTVGDNPFRECSSLTAITVSAVHPLLATINGVLFNKADKQLICYPTAISSQIYTIPQGIESIGAYAFSGCTTLTSVTIPETVTFITDNAFAGCTVLTLNVDRDSFAAQFAQTHRISHSYLSSTDWLTD